ncbi:hypothetical protein [Marinifilum caeruleilacunae]|uniref:Uncharacterized protein n=1 Tax=Marinifilum caeruleilacunae TaxID=2499076 RepID=A0ABX1WVX0_9BACT|nr:hypothetical protein [Marinifilum caeruleilacunae]NOU60270.1 hypothetical protein [Marinifilum caeruleilacunae]
MNKQCVHFGIVLILLSHFLFGMSKDLCAQEKVRFTTDRDFYIAGENIWFGLGIFDLEGNDKSKLSKVVYLELLNKENSPVVKHKFYLKNQNIQSCFQLPDDLPTGNYHLRAYTRLMKNRDASLFATKYIGLFNPFLRKNFPKGDKRYNRDTVFYYMENERLLANESNQLLIYACDQYGKPKSIKGSVLNKAEEPIEVLNTESSGYGVLNIVPKIDEKYMLSIDGLRIQLPDVTTETWILKLVETDESYTLRVLGKDKEGLFLDILNGDGKFIKHYKIQANKSIRIEKKDLPNTLLYALLVNESKEIKAFRGFQNYSNSHQLKISHDHKNYKTRELVKVHTSGLDSIKNISVSVVKSCLINDISDQNYTENKEQLLMLKKPSFLIQRRGENILLPEIDGDLISGEIIDLDSGLPIKNEEFTLSFVSQNPSLNVLTTDSLGAFRAVVNRYGREELVIRPKSEIPFSNYKVNLNDDFSYQLPDTKLTDLIIDTIQMKNINKAIINMQVNSIYGKHLSKTVDKILIDANPPFYIKADHTIKIDKFIELPTVEEVIREIVPFVNLRKNKDSYEFVVFEELSLYPRFCETMVFFDGVPIKNTQAILDINPQYLDRIEVVNLDFFLKGEGLGFLLCFYSRNSDMANLDFDNSIFRQVHQGYQYEYKYNSPDYSKPELKNSRLADYRNLLYFNVWDKGNADGTIDWEFYTSDDESEYTIIIKGIDKNGDSVSTSTTFNVAN